MNCSKLPGLDLNFRDALQKGLPVEMNGLDVIDLQPTGFLTRLLGRKPKENAFLEIHNVVATLPIFHISEAAITDCLSRYGTTHEAGKARLLNIYSQVLDYFIKDLALSNDEMEQLIHLSIIFKLTLNETSQIHAEIVHPHYERAVQRALEDGHLSDEEKDALDDLCTKLRIPQAVAKEIYKKHAVPIYNQAVSNALADKMLSPQEEADLDRIATSLRLKIRLNEKSEAVLQRARRLWHIAQGELPTLVVPVNLQFDERCSAQVRAVHYEPGRKTGGIGYSGFSASHSAFGIRFRSGIMNTQRLSKETMLRRDAGTLYFTNRRLLFNGTSKSTSIYLGRIIGITFYSDGVRIEKESGKDQIFTFSGDMDMLRLIADNLMSSYREEAQPGSARSRKTGSTSGSSGKKRASSAPVDKQETLKSAHEILEISVNASREEIKIAYRKMATLYHPDKVAHLAPEFRDMAEKKMKQINTAYEKLKSGK